MMLMLLFWIVPVALLVWAVPGLREGLHLTTRSETPLEILRRRYASGEIIREEFGQATRTLI